jgi:hypothetical protein
MIPFAAAVTAAHADPVLWGEAYLQLARLCGLASAA